MVSITFRFIIPGTWCHHRSVTSSWNLSTNVSDHHQPSDLFQDINWIHDEKYHPCPRWFVLSLITLLPSLEHKLVRVLCYTLSSLLSSIWSSLPWSITIFYVRNVVRISSPLKNSWYCDTSHQHHSFLVPMLILTRIPTSAWCCLYSVLLATLLHWS